MLRAFLLALGVTGFIAAVLSFIGLCALTAASLLSFDAFKWYLIVMLSGIFVGVFGIVAAGEL